MKAALFQNRDDAGRQLAERLKQLPLRDPIVLGIPRGGVVVAAAIARVLGAELDVVLSRKLRAPGQPELALGAVSETGEVHLSRHGEALTMEGAAWLERERLTQMEEIERRKKLFRAVRPQAALAGRSVIITDDGIATGSTMIAALRAARGQRPHELIAAAPVAPEDRLSEVQALADRVVCLAVPEDFWAVGQFYRDFDEVPDERVVDLLRGAACSRGDSGPATCLPCG